MRLRAAVLCDDERRVEVVGERPENRPQRVEAAPRGPDRDEVVRPLSAGYRILRYSFCRPSSSS